VPDIRTCIIPRVCMHAGIRLMHKGITDSNIVRFFSRQRFSDSYSRQHRNMKSRQHKSM
jgi:hypothetical protein